MEPEYLHPESVKGFSAAQGPQTWDVGDAGTSLAWLRLCPTRNASEHIAESQKSPKLPLLPHLHVIDISYVVMLSPSSLSDPCHWHRAGWMLFPYCC